MSCDTSTTANRATAFTIHFETVPIFALLCIREGSRLMTGEDMGTSKHIDITSSRLCRYRFSGYFGVIAGWNEDVFGNCKYVSCNNLSSLFRAYRARVFSIHFRTLNWVCPV